jgi:outer membrane receptor for ferrienterochelin and colicins
MRNKILFIFLLWIWPAIMQAQNDTTTVKSLLNLSLEELMNIKVVTASGFLQPTAEAPSTIQVVTAEQIKDRGYEQLEDVLRDVPGIDMIHINGYAPTLIYFRGMYGAENLRALLMIDGMVENNILGSNDIAGPAYSLHNVKRIEIIWGPASALYGSNAFGGVINIITKKGKDIEGLYAEKGFGTFNTTTEKISIGLRRSKFEFSASGSLYSTDGPKFINRDPNYNGSYVDRAYSFNSALSYFTKNNKITIGYRTSKTPMGWGTYANSPTTFLRLPAQGNNNIGVIGILSSDIRGEKSGLDKTYLRTLYTEYEYKPNEKFNLLSRVLYRETGIAEDSYVYVTIDGRKLIRAKVASASNRVSGETLINYAPSANHRFSAGIQFNQDNVEQGYRQTTTDPAVYLIDGRDSVTNIHSVFLRRQYDIRNNFGSYVQYVLSTSIFGKTNFTIGSRYDRNSYFGDAISPRIAITSQPSEKLIFKLHAGKAFRAPTNLEIHATPASGNFLLKQEKIYTYELNAIYTATKKIKLQLNGFHNDLSNVIFIANLSGLTPDKNPGVIHITGMEALMDMIVAKNTTGFANFTFQDALSKNLVNGNSAQTPGVARFKANAGFTFGLDDILTLTLSGNYVGNRPSPRTSPYGPVKGYCLANFNITSKPVFKDRVTAGIAIRNLLNTKWLDPGFRTADGALYATVLEQPGITGLFKICVSLK